MLRLIRVFPRRTKATPIDPLVAVNRPPGLFDEADRIHVSVSFTWDLPRAEQLAEDWRVVAPVEIGGPALGTRGEEFVPGRYLRLGYTITSRGCPNRCWFCRVWRAEVSIRELPIRDGSNVLDDNLLACSEGHVRSVFEMLARQPRPILFTGGLEAARLEPWAVALLRDLHPDKLYFAYDGPDDLEPLRRAGGMLLDAGVPQSRLYSYVLCGYPGDTTNEAARRMHEAWEAGFMPFAMFYRSTTRVRPPSIEWRLFTRRYARPALARRELR